MSTTNTRDHLAELIELKEALSETLIESRHAASIRSAQVRAANDGAELEYFTNATANTTTRTKPCK